MDYYKKSGVDLKFATEIPYLIKNIMEKYHMKSKNIGAFAAVKQLGNQYIAMSIDGVGSKMMIAEKLGKYDTIGIDLVAMNANDVLCSGLNPTFFLDYIGFGYLNKEVFLQIVEGIVKGVKMAQMELVGGESAQMKDLYQKKYELVGCAIGFGKAEELFKGKIKKGDILIGIKSNGLHSNGYSLINYLIKKEKLELTEDLLTPTEIYVKEIKKIRKKVKIKALSHITGGGILENIKRIIPKGLNIKLYYNWYIPEIFKRIQATGVSKDEMFRVFNMGIGMVLVIDRTDIEKISKKYFIIGEII